MEKIQKDGIEYEVVGKVLRTKNKDVFRHIEGNRTTNDIHLSRLKESIKKRDLKMPILVNSKMQVIDGQHRLMAYRELGNEYSVDFIIGNGLGIKEVQILNTNQKNWTMDNYLDTYCTLKKPEYLVYSDYKAQFPFTHDVAISLIVGVTGKPRMDHYNNFKDGLFECTYLDDAYAIGNKLLMIADTHPNVYRRSNFIYAMIRVMRLKKYNHSYFLKMLKRYPHDLEPTSSVPNYLGMIDSIYNRLIKKKSDMCEILYAGRGESE